MRIRTKMQCGTVLLAALIGISGYVAFKVVANVGRIFDDIAVHTMPVIDILDTVRVGGHRLVSSSTELGFHILARQNSGINSSEGEIDEERQLIAAGRHQLEEGLRRYRAHLEEPGYHPRNSYREIEAAARELVIASDLFVATALHSGSAVRLLSLKEEFEEREMLFLKAINHALTVEKENFREKRDLLRDISFETRQLLLAIIGVMLGLALMISLAVSRSVLVRLNFLREGTHRIGSGDLSQELQVGSGDEITELADDFNAMVARLRNSRDELVAARNHLDDLIGAMAESVVEVGRDGIIRSVNPATIDLIGGSAPLVGEPFSRVMPALPLTEIEAQGKLRHDERVYIGYDGQEIPVAFSGSAIRDGRGEIRSFVCLARDITERKRADMLLRRSEALLAEAQRIGRMGNWEWDIVADEIFWSEQIYRIFDISPDGFDATYQAFLATIHPDDRPLANRAMEDSLLLQEPLSIDYRVRTPLGEVRFIHAEGETKFDAAGRPVRMVGTLQDITERKQNEELLRRSFEDLAESHEELKSFSYIVSHDLRSPLVNIRGFAGELNMVLKELDQHVGNALECFDKSVRERVATIIHGEVPEALDFINASVQRMDTLISGILQLSRLGRRELLQEAVDINELVTEILRTLRHQLEEKQVKVTVDHLPEVLSDRLALEQIFGNLLDNAVKYLVPGQPGEITVEAKRSKEEILFTVRDNGRGVARDDHERIFEIFRRAGQVDVPGEGIGLAYVKTLVRRFGGRIWCESEVGKGSTFCFTLPLKRNTDVHKAAEAVVLS